MEYATVLTIVFTVILAMQTMVKRGTQSFIRVVADQIGNQLASEQKFDESGHLISAFTGVSASTSKRTRDFAGNITYIFNDAVLTLSNAYMNYGYSE